MVEGLNNKIRVIQRTAYGYRDEEYLKRKIISSFLPPLADYSKAKASDAAGARGAVAYAEHPESPRRHASVMHANAICSVRVPAWNGFFRGSRRLARRQRITRAADGFAP